MIDIGDRMTLYEKILVPTDGSESTEAAIDYALELAKTLGAHITALSVFDETNYSSIPDLPEHESFLYKESEEAVDRVVEEGKKKGVKVVKKVKSGIPAKEIIEASRHFDLIVMGTVGRTGISHLLLGSVAGKVVRFAACPVLVVNGKDGARTDVSSCRRILIPTDGSKATDLAVSQGLELAWTFKADVTALNVIDKKSTTEAAAMLGKVPYGPETQAMKAVDHVVSEGRKYGVQVRTKIVLGSPADVIVKASEEHDMVVMGTIGRTGLAYIKLGSVAERTVLSAKCPVLVVRANSK